jgi:hypothetical protein
MFRAQQENVARSATPITESVAESVAEPTRAAEPRWRRLRTAGPWLVMCCYLIGAVVLTAHLWVDPAGRVQLGGVNDVDLFAWFMRYAATAVSHGRLPALVTVGMNAPQGINLMWNTSFLLPGVLLAPLTLLAGPQVSLTLVLTLGFAGSAASLLRVLRRWGASLGAAALGGAVYGFSPAMLDAGFAHYHLQFAVLPPLIADAVLRLITGRGHGVRVGVWLGLLCAAQLFIGEELLVYTALACLVLAAAVAVSHLREVPRRALAATGGLVAAGAVFLLVDGWALWAQFTGPLTEHTKLSTPVGINPSYFVVPSAWLLFHTHASAAATPSIAFYSEDLSYLGWPLIGVLVIAMVVFWRDRRVRAAAVTCVVVELFALGGRNLPIGGFKWPGPLLPWHWLESFPGLAQVLPERFSILGDGAAAAVLAFSLDRALAAVPRAEGWQGWPTWRSWPRGALTGVALLAVLPLIPLPYRTTPVSPVPAGWQATFTTLRLASDAPVLVLPFPDLRQPQVLRWQADTGSPAAMIGGYFIEPSATGQASFYFSNRSQETDVASYLNELWLGRHPRSPSSEKLHAAFGYWRLAAIVVVADQQSPAIRVLTQLFGRPTYHIGTVFSWRLRR